MSGTTTKRAPPAVGAVVTAGITDACEERLHQVFALLKSIETEVADQLDEEAAGRAHWLTILAQRLVGEVLTSQGLR